MASKDGPTPNELFALKDAEVARTLMGTASEVCAALGVTVTFNVQIADESARDLDVIHKAIKDTIMVLSHIVVRSGLADRQTIQATYENPPQDEELNNEVSELS